MEYPYPYIPLSPVLSGQGLSLSNKNNGENLTPSILTAPNLLQVTSGRAAIALALEHAGVSEGDQVLVPAYHCESMISPVKWLGATPVFYRINSDTTIDIEDLERKIGNNTKAVIATHYFGFIQDMPPITALCARSNLILIEDCAHAFFGERGGKSVGSWGDYAITSTMKFFPVYDGGILASYKDSIKGIKLSSPSLFFQIKSPLNVIQKAVSYKRFGLLGTMLKYLTTAAEDAWRFAKKLGGREQSGIYGPSSSGGGYGLDELWIHCRASWFTKLVIKCQSKRRIVQLRRKNYLRLQKALSGLPNSRPLYADLPEGIVPLVFPLYVDDPEAHFDCLKRLGVPIWRFGEFLDKQITAELCSNSIALSAHIFQFSCHQELRDDELNWMIDQIKQSFQLTT